MGLNWRSKYQYEDDVWDAVEGTVSGLVLAALSGVLLYLAFPPLSFWPLAWVALVPLVTAQNQTMPDETCFIAAPAAVVVFLALHYQKVSVGFSLSKEALHPVTRFLLKDKPTALATVFVTFALLSVLERRFHRRTSWKYLVLEPVLFWIGLDFLRDATPVFGTSAAFAYSQFTVRHLVKIASLVGTFGVTGIIVAVNASLAACVMAVRRDDRGFLWRGHAPPKVKESLLRQAKVALAAVACFLVWSFASDLVPVQPAGRVTAGLVQPGGSFSFDQDRGMDTFRELTCEASLSGAKIVVWPEASFRSDPRTQDVWPGICDIARQAGCYLVVPYVAEVPGPAAVAPAPSSPASSAPGQGQPAAVQSSPRGLSTFINEGILLSPLGEVLGAGAKDHPVGILGETSATRGTYPAFETPWGKTGIMICYDLNFTDTARKLARNGARLLCVPSNDWRAVSQTQSMYAVFRAAENGVSLVKADTAYDSCIVSYEGTILRKVVDYAGAAAVLVADVPLRGQLPPAAYISYPLGLASLLVWIALMALSLRLRTPIAT